MASSFFGHPRGSDDADIAVLIAVDHVEPLLDRLVAAGFTVPANFARLEIEAHGSFNAVKGSSKVDFFALGDDLLDQGQIKRRQREVLPGFPGGIWITAPEDQILRKLSWSDDSDSARQFNDVISIIEISGDTLDNEYLDTTAAMVGLTDRLDHARRQAQY
jgi:hypothetical protein